MNTHVTCFLYQGKSLDIFKDNLCNWYFRLKDDETGESIGVLCLCFQQASELFDVTAKSLGLVNEYLN